MSHRQVYTAVAALAIALLLRLAVNPSLETVVEREFLAPLVVRNLPEGLAVVQAPSSATLIAVGAPADVDRFETGLTRAEADLSGAEPGSSRYPLRATGPVGARITLRSKVPTVTIETDRLESKPLDIVVEASGKPDPDLVVESLESDPRQIVVSGPSALVRRAVRARAMLSLRDVQPGSVPQVVPEVLDAFRRPVPGLRTDPSTVAVTPAVRAAGQVRRVPVSIIYQGQLPPGVVLVTAKVTPPQAALAGEAGLLASLGSVLTEPVDLATLTADKTVRLRLRLPEGVRLEVPAEFDAAITVRRQSPAGRRAP